MAENEVLCVHMMPLLWCAICTKKDEPEPVEDFDIFKDFRNV